MNIKKHNIILVAFFMSMLLAPLLFADFSGGKVSDRERRTLAERPPMEYAVQDTGDFIEQFNAWFSDNLGFRERLVNSYNQFNSTYSSGYYLDGSSVVLVGKEGHHFHTHYNQTLPVYQGEPWIDDEKMKRLATRLTDIDQYLSQKKIPFVVMFCTDKESVYEEYYPDFVIRGPDPTSLDEVMNYLYAHTEADVFCIKERLLYEKENYLLYPKTGDIYDLCHYNETGAFFAYQELMEHIGTYFPDLKSLSVDDVNIAYTDTGLSSVTLKQSSRSNQIEPRFFEDAIEYENHDLSLPTILLLHDSYAPYFRQYLSEHFGRTILHHYETMELLEQYIELYNPDIVVFESAERAIPSFSHHVINSSIH